MNIGATHFWGHADFYVSINTVPIKLGDDAVKNSIHMGTFTGLRVYPWAVGEGQGVKPYLGYKFSPWRYRQGDTPELSYKTTRIKGMVDAGLGWATSWGYFTLEGTKLLNPDFEVNLTDHRRTDARPLARMDCGHGPEHFPGNHLRRVEPREQAAQPGTARAQQARIVPGGGAQLRVPVVGSEGA